MTSNRKLGIVVWQHGYQKREKSLDASTFKAKAPVLDFENHTWYCRNNVKTICYFCWEDMCLCLTDIAIDSWVAEVTDQVHYR